MHVVLKPFPWSPDGIRVEDLKIRDRRDFGSATAGLLGEKLIGEEADADTGQPAASPDADPMVAGQQTTEPQASSDQGTAEVSPPAPVSAPAKSSKKYR